MVTILLIFAAAYLLGGIPCGYLIGKAKGVDIRELGSRNIGATNVTRTLGKPYGVLCFILDFLKGLLPTLAAKLWLAPWLGAPLDWAVIAAVFGAVLGHMKSPYLRFQGGKGVSTAAGAVLAITPYGALTAMLVWVVVVKSTRYVSLASITAALSLPLAAWLLSVTGVSPLPGLLLAMLALVAAATIVKHHANIARLLNGTENRFQKKA